MAQHRAAISKSDGSEREAMARQNLNKLGRALNSRIQEQHLTPDEIEEQIEQTKFKVYQDRYG